MVGHRDGGDPGLDRAPGVIRPGHALEHERSAPLLAQPGHVIPGPGIAASASTSPYAPKNVGAAPRPVWARFGTWSGRAPGPGLGVVRQPARPAGPATSGARRRASRFRSSCSGMTGLPQSRPLENDQSKRQRSAPRRRRLPGALHALAPGGRLCAPPSTSGRRSAGLAAVTSSMGLLAKRAQAHHRCPRAAAARATATSPSGWTA